MQCFSEVNSSCAGLTVPETEAGWNAFVAEIVSTGLAAIKVGLGLMAGSLSANMRKGLNALRCVLASGFINAWYLIAAAYYAAKEFGMEWAKRVARHKSVLTTEESYVEEEWEELVDKMNSVFEKFA